MKTGEFGRPGLLLAPLLLVALAASGEVTPPLGASASSAARSPSQSDGTTPRDPKAPVPGVSDGRGPTGPVSLKILRPTQEEEIPLPTEVASGAQVQVSLALENYETFFDPVTKTGQGVAIFLDGLPYFIHYEPSKLWAFRRVPPGTHTLRAVPIRPWGEPIREDDAFAMVTFRVGPKSEKNAPAPGEPILTVFSPKPRAKYLAMEAASLKFDFLVRGCRVSDVGEAGSCRIRYRIDDRPEVILTKPESVPLSGLSVGRHGFSVGLTRDGKLIPGAFTLVQVAFEVTGTVR